MQGNVKWGLWSVHNSSTLPLLPPQVAPPPIWDTVLRAEVLLELFHHGFFMRSQVLPPKPAPVWASLSTGLQVLPGAAAWASHGDTPSFGHPAATAWGPPWAVGWSLFHCESPWNAGGQPASPCSASQAAGESCPSFCSHFGVCRADFLLLHFSLHSMQHFALPDTGWVSPVSLLEVSGAVCVWHGKTLSSSYQGQPHSPTASTWHLHLAHELCTKCWSPEERSEHWLHQPLSCREYTSQTGLLHIHCTCGHHLCEVWKKTISEGYLFLNCYHCSNKMNNIHQNILKGSSCIFLSVVTQSVCLTGVLRALHQQWYRFIFLRYQSGNTSSQPSYTDENLNDTQLCRHCRRIKYFLKSYVGNREFLVLFLTSRTFSEKNISSVLSLYVCIYISLGMTPGLHIFIIKPH